MNLVRCTFMILVAFISSGAFSQDGRLPYHGVPPELQAKLKRASDALILARRLLRDSSLAEAISAFRIAVQLESELPGLSSSANYGLAQALTQAGRNAEALAAYREAFRWDPKREDLDTNGPPFMLLYSDYAILLAKEGRHEDARAVYYSCLRHLRAVRAHHEVIPYTIVFEPEEGMFSMEYSKERLISAAMLVKAPDSGDPESMAIAREVHRREPSWAAPLVILAMGSEDEPENLLRTAFGLARNDEERAWVKAYQDLELNKDVWVEMRLQLGLRISGIGVARRKASQVLARAKAELALHHVRIAGS